MGPSRRIPAAPLAGFPVGANLSPAERSLETPSGGNSREIVRKQARQLACMGLKRVCEGSGMGFWPSSQATLGSGDPGARAMARVRLGAGEIGGKAELEAKRRTLFLVGSGCGLSAGPQDHYLSSTFTTGRFPNVPFR